ncbi:MAG: Methionyl-tRNA formyltransferase [Chlamydiales bacterium]|nr:Methionyl-tRNA formyltransferase [Chlamydiales bacterium]
MRIVFFGTPKFAQTILDYLLEKGVEIVAVISRPDKPRGRSKKLISSPVKELALSKSLPIYQPTKASDPDFADFLRSLNADLFVVAAYAEILRQNILDIPKLGCINVHASILPKFRGAAPIQRAIMEGESVSGVTIMKMALKMDAGDILAIAKTSITPEMTAGELTEILADLGKVALMDVIKDLEEGRMEGTQQDPTQVTFAGKLTLEDGLINWARACEVVHNHVRGVTPKPGAWCWITVKGEKKRLLIKRACSAENVRGKPGEIVSENSNELVVACASGGIRLLEVQLEGKKRMAIKAFLQGNSLQDLCFGLSN